MTLNDLGRHNSPYFVFFSPNSIALLASYVTVVEDRPLMSVKYCLPVPERSLCYNLATCRAVLFLFCERVINVLNSLHNS